LNFAEVLETVFFIKSLENTDEDGVLVKIRYFAESFGDLPSLLMIDCVFWRIIVKFLDICCNTRVKYTLFASIEI
jgi:hypothetical protein